jgi:hypothetical protein
MYAYKTKNKLEEKELKDKAKRLKGIKRDVVENHITLMITKMPYLTINVINIR